VTIGARVLKTGMAVALAIYLSGLIGFPSPIIAAVAAIFTIQPSVYRSWQQIAEQFQANIVGAGIALAAGLMFGHTPIAVGLVCIVVITLSIRFKMESVIGLTLVTVVAVMEANSQSWSFAVERFLMVLTGMGAAFAVNILIFPPRPRKQFMQQVHQAYDKLSLLLRTAISNEMKEQVYRDEKEKLEEMLRKLDERYAVFEEERALLPGRKQELARQLILSKQMIKALRKGAELLEAVEEHYFSSPGADKWAAPFDRQIEELSKYHEYILLNAEGKMKSGAHIEPEEERESRLAEQLTDYFKQERDEGRRLVFVAAALFEYAWHLRRLDRIIDHIKQREGSRGNRSELA
jgi:Predicted membrane protein